MAKRIFTGQAHPSDYLLFLYLLNIKAKGPKPPPEEGNQQGDKDGDGKPKDDGEQQGDKDGDGKPKNNTEGEEGQQNKEKGGGDAYAESDGKSKPPIVSEWKGSTDYTKINTNRFKINEGADFTPAQKKAIYEANMEHNEGILRSDLDGTVLEIPQKSQSGVTPSQTEAQVDHINPKSKGGTNDPSDNAQVLSRKQNRDKWDN